MRDARLLSYNAVYVIVSFQEQIEIDKTVLKCLNLILYFRQRFA